MTNEEIFISDLEGFLSLKFDDYGKRRVLGYLNEYRENLPPKIVIKEKIRVEYVEKIELRYVSEPIEPSKPLLTEQIMIDYGNELCEKYGINFPEFRKAKYRKSRAIIADVRRIFSRDIMSNYRCTRQQLQDFFSVDHTTIGFYLNDSKTLVNYKKPTLPQQTA